MFLKALPIQFTHWNPGVDLSFKPMMDISHISYISTNPYKCPPISAKFINFTPIYIFVQSTFFLLNLCFLCFRSILIMMHLRIMLYTIGLLQDAPAAAIGFGRPKCLYARPIIGEILMPKSHHVTKALPSSTVYCIICICMLTIRDK